MGTVISILVGLVFLVIFGGLFSKMVLVKAPPDIAYVISGFKKKVLIGKAGICIPILNRLDKLPLQIITVDVKNESKIPTPTLDKIKVYADAEVQIRVASEDEVLFEKAMMNFLNKTPDEIAKVVKGTLEASLREKIGNTKLLDLLGNRESLSASVAENGKAELESMGLKIIAFNIQSIVDEDGIIDQLGAEESSRILKASSIAKSNSEKEVAIQRSKDEEITQLQKNQAELTIAKNTKDLNLQKAKFLEETNIADEKALAAKTIEKAQQSKLIQAAEQEAEIASKKKMIELQELVTKVEIERLNSEIKSKADAKLYQDQKSYEAETYKIKQEADAESYQRKLTSEAEFYAKQQEAAAKKLEAESIEAIGKAEASAQRAKLEAEAEGLSKKAEAMAKMDDAAKLQMVLEVLPKIAEAVAKPMEKIGSITMYGNGDTSSLTGTVLNTVKQVMDGVSDATGVDVMSTLTNKFNPTPKEVIVDTNEDVSGLFTALEDEDFDFISEDVTEDETK